MEIQKLRESWQATITKAKAIRDSANDRDITDDEASQITNLMQEAYGLRQQIDAAEKRINALASLDSAVKTSGQPLPRIAEEDAGVGPIDFAGIEDRREEALRQRAELRRRQPWNYGVRPSRMIAFQNNERGREDAYRSGMWIRAALFGDMGAHQWCKDHGVNVQIGAVMGGTNPGGEYLVPEEMSQTMIDLRETYGIARRLAFIEPMASDTKLINRRHSGLTAYAVGRVLTSTVTASDLVFGQVELSAKTWAALCLISKDLNDDATINLADRVADEMAYAFAATEDDCYFNGDGTSTYHGINGIRNKIIDGTHTAGAVDAASGHDTFAELDGDDLDTLLAAAPQYVLESPNACFVCSSRGYAQTFMPLLRGGGGNNMTDLSGRPMRAYLGYPIVISQKMPKVSSDISDTAMILFGDFRRGSVIGDRMGFSAQVLNERYAELRQVGIIGATRFDINIHGLGDTTDAGAILALLGE